MEDMAEYLIVVEQHLMEDMLSLRNLQNNNGFSWVNF
jgi:hypothetical protein